MNENRSWRVRVSVNLDFKIVDRFDWDLIQFIDCEAESAEHLFDTVPALQKVHLKWVDV